MFFSGDYTLQIEHYIIAILQLQWDSSKQKGVYRNREPHSLLHCKHVSSRTSSPCEMFLYTIHSIHGLTNLVFS